MIPIVNMLVLKGMVHPKMNGHLFTHPHVVLKLYGFLLLNKKEIWVNR